MLLMIIWCLWQFIVSETCFLLWSPLRCDWEVSSCDIMTWCWDRNGKWKWDRRWRNSRMLIRLPWPSRGSLCFIAPSFTHILQPFLNSLKIKLLKFILRRKTNAHYILLVREWLLNFITSEFYICWWSRKPHYSHDCGLWAAKVFLAVLWLSGSVFR